MQARIFNKLRCHVAMESDIARCHPVGEFSSDRAWMLCSVNVLSLAGAAHRVRNNDRRHWEDTKRSAKVSCYAAPDR